MQKESPRNLPKSPAPSLVNTNMQICMLTLHEVWWRVTGKLWAEQFSEFAQSWGSLELLKLEWNILIDHAGHSVETLKDIYLGSVTEIFLCKVNSNPALSKFFKKIPKDKTKPKVYYHLSEKVAQQS